MIARVAVGAVVVALLIACAVVQLASDSFAASAAISGALPARIPIAPAIAVYEVLDRVAPAEYVETTLAAYELSQGRVRTALHYALRMPASSARDEMLGRVAAAQGDAALALEYDLAAPDVAGVQSAVDEVLSASPAAAYALEGALNARLSLTSTHPDAVAETSWRMGELANRQAWREVPASPQQVAWLRRAMQRFAIASDLAPLSGKYAIAAANQAALLGDLGGASRLFARAATADPTSADALAGLGVIAYRRGDLVAAQGYLVRARRLDPHALMVSALERDLGNPPARH